MSHPGEQAHEATLSKRLSEGLCQTEPLSLSLFLLTLTVTLCSSPVTGLLYSPSLAAESLFFFRPTKLLQRISEFAALRKAMEKVLFL